MRLEITKKYEKADLFMGFQWFNYNFHAITDLQTTPSLAQPELFDTLLSEEPDSLSTMIGYLSSIYGEGEIDEDSLEAFLFLNINQMNISQEEREEIMKKIQTTDDLLKAQAKNEDKWGKTLAAIGKRIAIQDNIDIKQIIKKEFFESRKIYNSPILFGENDHNKNKNNNFI